MALLTLFTFLLKSNIKTPFAAASAQQIASFDRAKHVPGLVTMQLPVSLRAPCIWKLNEHDNMKVAAVECSLRDTC